MSIAWHRLISSSQTWLRQILWAQNKKRNIKCCVSHVSSVAYVWGAGDGGQLGTGNQKHSLVPIRLPLLAEASHIACGYGFTVAVGKGIPRPWTVGLNTFSQLGRSQMCGDLKIESVPTPVELYTNPPLSEQVQQISCGRSHSAMLLDNGEVWTWGGNFHGQCGTGSKEAKVIEKLSKIPNVTGKIKQVTCGLDHTLLLSTDGTVMSCGWGADGQTGLNHFKDEATCKVIEGELKDVRIKQIATSGDCCLALSDEGEIFSWGNNEYGQLAVDEEDEQFAVPIRATLLRNLPQVQQVAAGGSFCIALTVTGELYSWGYGVLGHGKEVSFTKTPRKIEEFSKIDDTISSLICGPESCAVLTESGNLYTWGRGSFGRLGLGSTLNQWTPKRVEVSGKVMEVTCGMDHMAAIVAFS